MSLLSMSCANFSSTCLCLCPFFFFNDTATTEIYTLSLHDALPISTGCPRSTPTSATRTCRSGRSRSTARIDRKSTRLNSSHSQISYAVFCLKKKKNKRRHPEQLIIAQDKRKREPRNSTQQSTNSYN